jgi:hypothetical protein
MNPRLLCLGVFAASTIVTPAAERRDVNYDESKVGTYTLPDPLLLANGPRVTDAATWTRQRRPELLELFRTHVYGRGPGRPAGMKFEVVRVDRGAVQGLATRKEVVVYFTGAKDGPKMTVHLYVPNAATRPVPAFLGLNFMGNHTVEADPTLPIATSWMREAKDGTVVDHRATEKGRGLQASRWQIEKVIRRGYATATIYYGDIEPDHAEGWRDGVRAVFQPDGRLRSSRPPAATPGATSTGAPADATPHDWGAIGAWAWGLSRALDYLETDKDIDATRVAVHGHSRLGKTSLWAGAADERFALVISNDSGEGGAALARRNFGETTAIITKAFPHWFCNRFDTYANNASALPVDQHELIALMAPRPVYVASAEEDKWADPHGEFLAAKHAEPVYALFKKAGLGVKEMPAVNHPVGATLGYHMRTGVHDITAYDWEQYLNFADTHFKRTR